MLDENVPRALLRYLPAHSVSTVQESGLAGIRNGDLLDRLEGMYDVLITADKNLRYQQNLAARKVAIVELPTNRWPLLRPLINRIIELVTRISPGAYVRLELDQ